MEGPFQLAESVIDAVATETAPAVYLIRRIEETGTYAHYKARIGRTNGSALKDELKKWIGSDYRVFCFEYVEDDITAFYRQCILWHDMGGPASKLDNGQHPEPDAGFAILCPICSDTLANPGST